MRVRSKHGRNGGARHQRGDMLLEAMIGVVITALLGAGMVFVMSRVMNTQHTATVKQLVVENLRQELQVKGLRLCSETPGIAMPEKLASKAVTAIGTATCQPQATDVVLAGRTIAVNAPDEVTFSVRLDQLGLRESAETSQPLQMSTKSPVVPSTTTGS